MSTMGEYIASGVADERFLPVIEADASEIVPGLYLGSEANAKDVVWLKVRGISRIVTINSNPLDIFSEDCSESLKVWLKTNVKRLYVQALDSPTQTVSY